MQFEITANGNAQFNLESESEREDLERLMSHPVHPDHGVLAFMLDLFGFLGNGQLYPVLPEQVAGALTDAPMFTDQMNYPEDGMSVPTGRLWWFPSYESTSFAQELLEKGSVQFVFAGELTAAA